MENKADATTALDTFMKSIYLRLVTVNDRAKIAWHVAVTTDPDRERALEEAVTRKHLDVKDDETIIASGFISEGTKPESAYCIIDTLREALMIIHCADNSCCYLKVNKDKRALLENLRLNYNNLEAMRSYGELLHIGWGHDPPEFVAISILRTYFRQENKGYNDANLFQAARKGNVENFKMQLIGRTNLAKDIVDDNGWTLLHHASFGGETLIIKILLEMKLSVHEKDKTGRKPIHIAAREGFVDVIKLFLENIYVDDIDNYKWTPLHHATWGGHLPAVYLLLDKCAEIDAREHWNRAKAIHLAAREGHTAIVEALLGRNARINDTDRSGRTPLYYAAWKGHMSTVDFLVNKGADLYYNTFEELHGKMAVHIAAVQGHTGIVMSLIAKSKELLNMQSANGWTPLQYADYMGQEGTVKFLIDNGASLPWMNEENKYGYLYLHAAAKRGDLNAVKHYIEAGFGTKDIGTESQTVLHSAVFSNKKEVVQFVVKVLVMRQKCFHIDVTEKKDGFSPLMSAASCGFTDSVQALLECGANIEFKSADNSTALHIASIHGHLEVVRILVDNDANINVKNNFYFTPLHEAAKNRNKALIQFLIANNADVDARDHNDKMPSDYAGEMQCLFEFVPSAVTQRNSEPVGGDSVASAVPLVVTKEMVAVKKSSSTEKEETNHSAQLEIIEKNKEEMKDEILRLTAREEEVQLKINCKTARLEEVMKKMKDLKCHEKKLEELGLESEFLSSRVKEKIKEIEDLDCQKKLETIENIKKDEILHSIARKDELLLECKLLISRLNEITEEIRDLKSQKKGIDNSADVDAGDGKGKSPLNYAEERRIFKSVPSPVTERNSTVAQEEKKLAVEENSSIEEEANHSAKGNNNPARVGNSFLKSMDRKWRENNTEIERWKFDEVLVEFLSLLNIRIVTCSSEGKEAWCRVIISQDPNVEKEFEEACRGPTDIEIFEGYGMVLNSGWVSEGTKPNEPIMDTLQKDLITRNLDNGAWYYLVAKENKEAFLEHRHLDWNNEEVILKYYELLHSGWGKDPPELITLKILEAYYKHDYAKGLESDSSNYKLNKAARECDHELLSYYLEENDIDVHQEDVNNWTLLHHASFGGDVQVIRNLLEMGSSIYDEDIFRRQPIHIAAREGFESVIEIFLDAGIDVDIEDQFCWTALLYAAWGGHLSAVNLLLDKHADIDAAESFHEAKAIHLSAREGHLEIVKALLGSGAAVNATDIRGRTPLYYAVWKYHIPVVEFLIDKGADMYCDQLGGKLAIHIAAVYGFTNIVRILIKKYKDLLNEKSSEGWSPLRYADYNGCKETVKFLINKGALIYEAYNDTMLDYDVKDRYVYLSLHAAAKKGDLDAVKQYIEAGVGTDHLGSEFQSVLHSAVLSDEKKVLEFIIEELVIKQNCLHIDVVLEEKHGITPLMIAAHAGKQNSVQILLENHADIDFQSELSPHSALHFAVSGRQLRIVEMLVNKHASINIQNRTGQTPLHYAAIYKDEAIYKFLIDNNADVGVIDSDGKTPSDYM